jgi:hypothetical protein
MIPNTTASAPMTPSASGRPRLTHPWSRPTGRWWPTHEPVAARGSPEPKCVSRLVPPIQPSTSLAPTRSLREAPWSPPWRSRDRHGNHVDGSRPVVDQAGWTLPSRWARVMDNMTWTPRGRLKASYFAQPAQASSGNDVGQIAPWVAAPCCRTPWCRRPPRRALQSAALPASLLSPTAQSTEYSQFAVNCSRLQLRRSKWSKCLPVFLDCSA